MRVQVDLTRKIRNSFPLASPVRIVGQVIKGYGRGSKLLGMPTANLPADDYKEELQGMEMGVYIGYANVDGGPIYKTVLGIGDNPQFKNKTKTIEPYLLHEFPEDFYGSELRLVIVGFTRPYLSFSSIQELKDTMHNDVKTGRETLDDPEYEKYSNDPFLLKSE
ncbi:riboflavin kinase, partial [Acrasis kona]